MMTYLDSRHLTHREVGNAECCRSKIGRGARPCGPAALSKSAILPICRMGPQVQAGHHPSFSGKAKGPNLAAWAFCFCIKSLAMTYFRMRQAHTIIGAECFHFRVRKGIGWFPLAMVAKQTVLPS